MNKKEYAVDKALEAMLKAAAPEIEKRLEEDSTEGFENYRHEFSEKHKNDMAELFKKYRKEQFYRNLRSYTRSAAIIFIVVILISVATIGSVSALRARFMNFIMEMTDRDTTIRFIDDSKPNLHSSDDIILGYVPEGFELEKREIINGHILLEFTKDNDFFDFYTMDINGMLSIDTEDSIYKEIVVNGRNGFLSIKDNNKILVWNDDKRAYVLTGTLSEKELIKIAENKN